MYKEWLLVILKSNFVVWWALGECDDLTMSNMSNMNGVDGHWVDFMTGLVFGHMAAKSEKVSEF